MINPANNLAQIETISETETEVSEIVENKTTDKDHKIQELEARVQQLELDKQAQQEKLKVRESRLAAHLPDLISITERELSALKINAVSVPYSNVDSRDCFIKNHIDVIIAKHDKLVALKKEQEDFLAGRTG